MMHLFGVGDHGGGPTRSMLDTGMHWTDRNMVFATTTWGVAQGFFSDVENKLDTEHSPVWNYKALAAGDTKLQDPPAGKISLPVWNDELYFEYHRGVFTTQSNHKRNMREGEEQVLNAEKISSLAWADGAPYPATRSRKLGRKCFSINFTISPPDRESASSIRTRSVTMTMFVGYRPMEYKRISQNRERNEDERNPRSAGDGLESTGVGADRSGGS